MAATAAGVILGTAAYMSPEQAKGFQADRRSDVFSFGSVLYEMLTGRQAFQGDTAPEILASVLVREPDLNALPPNLNPRLSELLRRCVEKNPKRRWQAIGDLRAELETIALNPRSAPIASQVVLEKPPLWRRAIPALVTAVLASAVTGISVWSFRPSNPPNITRFSFRLPEGQQFTNPGRQLIAISPDGTQMVYVANGRLHLRSISELEARAIPGTEISQGVAHPVFSPDGRSIAFWSGDQTLKRIAVTGGAAVTICPADSPFGVSWDTEGIIFGQGSKGIMRVSANGGEPQLLVSVEGQELAHGPQMLPDGETVLFTLATGSGGDRWDKAQIVVQSLKSAERKTLVEGGTDARYLPTGQILYALGGTLFAVPFDLDRLEVTGGPVPIVEGVRRAVPGATGSAHFAFSTTGSLVYVPGPALTSSAQVDLALMDRKGGVELLNLSPASYEYPRVSPDGKRIAVGTDDGKEAIVWIHDLSGASALRRLTFGGRNRFPIWSADGQRVAFQSDREGDLAIFWQLADGTGTAERLTKPDQGTSHIPEAWSPNGETLLFSVTEGSTVSLWAFSMQNKKAIPFDAVQSSNPTTAVFSPDGRWVAYASNERGTDSIYVQPFPATGAKFQIFSNPGDGPHHPRWSPDGKEIFYIPRGGALEAVSVSTQPTFAFGNPMPVPRRFPTASPTTPRTWDVTPDGKIVGVVGAGQTESGTLTAPEIQVVLNWFEDLKQRVPVP
jgi:serine/threonine-protein kinase